eukprot:350372-Chlamydomonas_euryale.AAC.2
MPSPPCGRPQPRPRALVDALRTPAAHCRDPSRVGGAQLRASRCRPGIRLLLDAKEGGALLVAALLVTAVCPPPPHPPQLPTAPRHMRWVHDSMRWNHAVDKVCVSNGFPHLLEQQVADVLSHRDHLSVLPTGLELLQAGGKEVPPRDLTPLHDRRALAGACCTALRKHVETGTAAASIPRDRPRSVAPTPISSWGRTHSAGTRIQPACQKLFQR